MASSLFHDISNATTGLEGCKAKRLGRFRLRPLALSASSSRSEPHASMRKSPPICTVSFEHASSCSTNLIPFPASDSVDSEPDIESRPHKSRRCSQDSSSAGSQTGDRQTTRQPEPRRRRVTSHRHSLLSPAAYTCSSSPALRPRSASFSHARKLTMRESSDLRFLAMVRRSVLGMDSYEDYMDLDDPSRDDLLRHQDGELCSRIEEYLLQRGYRDMYHEGEPIRTSVLLSDMNEPCLSSEQRHPHTLTRTQLVAALILKHKTRLSVRQRFRVAAEERCERPSSPLARQD